jgi:hypothetical protein
MAISLAEREWIAHRGLVLDRDVQIATGSTHFGMARRVADLGQRSAAGQSVADEAVLVQREMEFALGSLAGNDGTTGFALGGRC